MPITRKPQRHTGSKLGNRLLQAAVDAGTLMAAADGELADDELTALASLLNDMSDGALAEQQVIAAIRTSIGELGDDAEARIEALAGAVTSQEDREQVLTVASIVLLADGDTDNDDENETFYALAEAFEFDEDETQAIYENAEGLFHGEASDDDEEEDDEEEDAKDGDDEEEDDEEEDDEEEDGDDEEEDDEEEDDEEEEVAEEAPKERSLRDDTLRRGDRGHEVQRLQAALNEQGYSLTVDGAFGSGTEAALRQFQRANGLTADGLAGPRTRSMLGIGGSTGRVQHTGGGGAPAPKPAPQRNNTGFALGARGSAVREVQQLLVNHGFSVSVDGIFGPGTDRAVRGFQRMQGLSVDGIVGRNTLAYLRG